MKMYVATIPGQALSVRSKDSYYALQKKLFVLLVIVVSLVPLLVISWTASHFYRESWQRQTSLSLASMASSRREVINLFLEGQEDLLAGLVDLYSVNELANQEMLKKVFAASNHSGVLVDIGVIDRAGRHLSYVGPFRDQLLNKNYAESEWFQEVIKNGRYVSDVFQGFRGVPHFVVAVAAPDKSWVLRSTVNSELFNALLETTEVGPGGDAFIINAQGELQTPSRLGDNILPQGQFAVLERKEENQAFFYQDFLYVTSRMKNNDWLLVLKTDIHTSLAEFYRARNRDRLIIAFATLIILGVATFLVRSMVGRIEKADSQRMTLSNRIRQAEKMALVGRLAAGVAHEINNPLQIIGDQAGWIEELLEDDIDRQQQNMAEYRRSTAKIREQVKRASTITHRLLGFSRKESGRAEIDINLLVEGSLSFLENEAKKHRIVIRKYLAAGLGFVQTDASQLQQVFLNIVNNAIDAIGEDGVITITTGRTVDQFTIEFADTGTGINKEDLAKIFDPFFTTKEKGKGTGLGLSISYDIMQRLGGDLQARNGSSGGSVFKVILPAPMMPRMGTEAKSNHISKGKSDAEAKSIDCR